MRPVRDAEFFSSRNLFATFRNKKQSLSDSIFNKFFRFIDFCRRNVTFALSAGARA